MRTESQVVWPEASSGKTKMGRKRLDFGSMTSRLQFDGKMLSVEDYFARLGSGYMTCRVTQARICRLGGGVKGGLCAWPCGG